MAFGSSWYFSGRKLKFPYLFTAPGLFPAANVQIYMPREPFRDPNNAPVLENSVSDNLIGAGPQQEEKEVTEIRESELKTHITELVR